MSVNYAAGHNDYLNRYNSRYGQVVYTQQQGVTTTTNGVSNPVVQQQNYDEVTLSRIEDNTCTDGQDDGKISTWSKIGNTIEGVGKGAIDMVKSAFKHPIKTLAMAALACVPVVGPIAITAMSAYGLYQGGKQIVNAWNASENATTDAEAKAAFENIGTGALTVGLSATGVKAGAGMLKNQLAGGSTTVNAVKAAKSGEKFSTAVREGVKETGANAVLAAKAIYNKGKAVFDKTRQYYDKAKAGELGQQVKADIDNIATKAGDKAQKIADKAKETKDKLTPKDKATTQAQQEALINKQKQKGLRIEIEEGKLPAGVTKNADGTYQKTMSNGAVRLYDKKGLIISETSKGGIVTTYKNGVKVSKASSSTTKKGVKTENKSQYKDGVEVKNSQVKTGADGKVVAKTEVSVENLPNGVQVKTTKELVNGKTVKTVEVTKNGQVLTGQEAAEAVAPKGNNPFWMGTQVIVQDKDEM